jgi:hypothetical protein
MPQILGDVGMLVPVHLALWRLVSAVATHLPPGLACQNPTQVAGPGSPRLTAKLTANPADNRDSWRTALDGYIRPELRRCDRRWLPEQLTSPGIEEPNGVGRSHVPWNYGSIMVGLWMTWVYLYKG